MSPLAPAQAREVVAQLLRCKVPMVYRTLYQDGVPAEAGWTVSTCTKRDQFFRINGKIVPRNIASWAIREGAAVFSPA